MADQGIQNMFKAVHSFNAINYDVVDSVEVHNALQTGIYRSVSVRERLWLPKKIIIPILLFASRVNTTMANIHQYVRIEKNPIIDEEGVEEQEFYEEVVVDDKGFIKEKKFVIVAQNNEGKKYIQVPQAEENRYGSRYTVPQSEENRSGSRYGIQKQISYESPKNIENKTIRSQRYEYIPMQEQENRYMSPKTTPKKIQSHEEVEVVSGRVHRYAVIQTEEETELTTRNGRYALVPVEQLNTVTTPQNTVAVQNTAAHPQIKNRYEYIQDSPRQMIHQSPSKYEYIQSSPQKPPLTNARYEYIQQTPQQQRMGNPIATQKLHELLSTPKKPQVTSKHQTPQKVVSPQTKIKMSPPQLSPISKENYQKPTKTSPKIRCQVPKAQQKLNYALGTRQLVQQDKRHTAIVAPMCSSPIHSVYSETTYSNKSESWMNLSIDKSPVQATLTIAATMMLLCGGVTSGYLVLSVFSLLTCASLLVLLVMQPRPGTPLADITSGAVCSVSVLSLVLATTGVVSSYCCKYPPPDNRVQHCAEGFTV
ncbi:hypothetical protein NQ314_005703 [Rhamnusium bicolor]|uniref:Uncharacterized protein n=1 Tax=Rhamnusium bicolor TaxID=1586634 RepID=A0AAV8ZE00_9CUCU|nr:hypothetical protein NQ314_005703 [Rhamnusium bicolor]